MDAREYYRILYRLDGAERFLLWFTGDHDGVVTDADGRVPAFVSNDDLRVFADNLGIEVVEETPILHDLDAIRNWLRDPRPTNVNCQAVLAAWNLFIDVAHSVADGVSFLKIDHELDVVYEKAFWGNNLPAVTPEGESYHPLWSLEEMQGLVKLLAQGLELFDQVVRFES